MKGIELIYKERQEQIVKHGYTPEFELANPQWYADGQRIKAAEFCMHFGFNLWPEGWNEVQMVKIMNKSTFDRFIVCGALLLAEWESGSGKVTENQIYGVAAILDNMMNIFPSRDC